jgi:hypothetical protein
MMSRRVEVPGDGREKKSRLKRSPNTQYKPKPEPENAHAACVQVAEATRRWVSEPDGRVYP